MAVIGLAVFRPAASNEVPEDILWANCPAQPIISGRPESNAAAPETITVHADEARFAKRQGTSEFSGGVEFSQGTQAMRADVLTYDQETNRVRARGRVRYWDDGIFWSGQRANADQENNTVEAEDGEYRLLQRRGHGTVRKVEVERDNNLTYLNDVEYTTCPGITPAWKIFSKSLKINHTTERARALHVVMRVKDVPVLYFPYANFPISDRRQTGFLFPSLRVSSTSGYDATLPFYWNIAPTQDATFTARVLSRRGVVIGGQYRYLNEQGHGQVDVEVLPSDSLRDGDARGAFGLQIDQRFVNSRVRATADVAVVSDDEYIEDLGTSLSRTSRRYLQQRGALSYTARRWMVNALVQNFQNIDPSRTAAVDPYTRLPELTFRTLFPRQNRRPNFQFFGQTTHFANADDVVTGTRVVVNPEVSFPIRSPGAFLIPRLQLNHTQYYLDNTAAGANRDPERTLPIVSVDSGLVLEREFQLGHRGFLHTIEPRLLYLYIPNNDQTDIPRFDGGLFDLSYSNLFRENRFAGNDRLGDANHFATGITSRLIKRNTGRELIRASLGTQVFLSERRVGLGAEIIPDDPTSEVIAEVSTRITSNLRSTFDLHWDPYDGLIEKGSARLRYQTDRGKVLNASYRFRRNQAGVRELDLEQTDVSGRWPLTPTVSLVGRWNYSLRMQETLEALAGFEYNSCCWGLRAVFRHFLRNSDGEFDNAFLVQLELKGLGGLGGKTQAFLRENIPGYENDF